MDNSSQIIFFRKITGQIHRSLKIYLAILMLLVQSGHSLQDLITGVQVTFPTEVKLDLEILIPDLLQLSENHFCLQTKPSTTLRECGIPSQMLKKTYSGGMMTVKVARILKVSEITNLLKIQSLLLVLIQFIGTGISSTLGIMVTGLAAQTTLSLIILLTLQFKILL